MSTPPRLWRNGLDYEPKPTYPPDYSHVPDVREWQMSPFSHERFDLDEIQRAEQKGAKGQAEVERLKRLYGSSPPPPPPEEEKPECPVCAERAKAEKLRKENKCDEYLYQPYGPLVMSSLSFSRPETNKPKRYSILGPSFYSGFRIRGKQDTNTPDPCSTLENDSSKRDFSNVYVPYGPFGEIRLTQDMYVPMGPPVLPKPNK